MRSIVMPRGLVLGLTMLLAGSSTAGSFENFPTSDDPPATAPFANVPVSAGLTDGSHDTFEVVVARCVGCLQPAIASILNESTLLWQT